MTFYDDPNREAVGQPPIWTGADTEPAAAAASGGGFDPGEYTVDEVNDYLDAHPDQRAAIVAAEADGKNRVGIVGG